jgi:hypothetical protein
MRTVLVDVQCGQGAVTDDALKMEVPFEIPVTAMATTDAGYGN